MPVRTHTTSSTTTTLVAGRRAAQPNRPLAVTMVIDTSGSMAGGTITSVLKGMKKIFQTLQASDDLSVKVFNNSARTLMGYQKKPVVNWNRIRADVLNNVGGGTALYDAVLDALKTTDYSSPAQRELIIFTDGEDNSSSTSYATLQQAMRTRKPDQVVRKNLHITMVGAGFRSSAQRLLEQLCQPAHCKFSERSPPDGPDAPHHHHHHQYGSVCRFRPLEPGRRSP